MHAIPLSRRPGRVTALLLLLVVGILAPGPISARSAPALVPVSSVDLYSSCPAERAASSQVSETRLAVNPTSLGTDHENLVAIWQQDPLDVLTSGVPEGIIAASSFDGGLTWTSSTLPFTPCAASGLGLGPPAHEVADPWVSIGPDGTVYASAIDTPLGDTSGGPGYSALAAVSGDGGRTWTDVQEVPAGTFFGSDKDSVTADPIHAGVAYLVWNTEETVIPSPLPVGYSPGVTVVSRTLDGGKTWSVPRVILRRPYSNSIDHQILVDPRTDTLYDIFLMHERKTKLKVCTQAKGRKHHKGRKRCHTAWLANPRSIVGMVTSHNQGLSWSAIHVVARVWPPAHAQAGPRTDPGSPEGAIDPATGTIYLTWEDAEGTKQGYGRIKLTHSSDGGAHWSAPRPVGGPGGTHEGLPSVAVGLNGTVGLTYYTLPDLPPESGQRIPADYWFAEAPDGVHVTRHLHLAGPMNLAFTGGAFFLGDYQGLAADGSRFLSLFVLPSSAGPPGEVVGTSIPAAAPSAPTTEK